MLTYIGKLCFAYAFATIVITLFGLAVVGVGYAFVHWPFPSFVALVGCLFGYLIISLAESIRKVL